MKIGILFTVNEYRSKPEPSFSGKYVNFPPVRMYPKPAQAGGGRRS
jgi:hypothetical protein